MNTWDTLARLWSKLITYALTPLDCINNALYGKEEMRRFWAEDSFKSETGPKITMPGAKNLE